MAALSISSPPVRQPDVGKNMKLVEPQEDEEEEEEVNKEQR